MTTIPLHSTATVSRLPPPSSTQACTYTPEKTREYAQKINEATAFIRSRLGEGKLADIAIVLGSGLGQFAQRFTETKSIPYSDIPHMVHTTVSGHSGTLILGTLASGKKILTFAGRVHAYEGIPMFEVTYLARLAHALGCLIFIATNAAGGALNQMLPGDAMIITDHISFLKRNPLQEVFADPALCPDELHSSAEIYSARIADQADEIAESVPEFRLHRGVYGCCPGPSYETPLEVRAGENSGVGAFGMSTAPECMVAKSLGMEVFALSLCTNLAAGISQVELSHEEVKEVADKSGPLLMTFMEKLLNNLEPTHDAATVVLNPKEHPGVTFNRIVDRATESQIQEAKQYIQAQTSLETFSGAVQLPVKLVDEFMASQFVSDISHIILSEIPHFPSLAGRTGRAIVGKNEHGHGVLALIPGSQSGFLPAEAAFLVQLMHALNIGSFVFSAVGARANPSDDSVFLINDAYDGTTVRTYTDIHPLPDFVSDVAVFNDNELVTGHKQFNAIDYLQLPGPSAPTPAEQSMLFEGTPEAMLGTTSPQIAFAARAAGLRVAGVAAEPYTLPAFASKDNEEAIYRQMMTLLGNTVRNLNMAMPVALSVKPAARLPRKQVEYEMKDPIQGVPETINPVIEQLKQRQARVAFVVHGPLFSKFKSQLNNVEEIVPEGGTFCPIYAAQYRDQDILVVHQTRAHHQGYEFYEVTASVRAVSGAGIQKLCVVTPLCSAHESLTVGDVAVISDHLNFCGRSPLFGPQVDGWGARFPDMSSVWTKVTPPEETKSKIHDLHIGVVVGPVFFSPLEARFIAACAVQAISTNAGWDGMVAKHMNRAIKVAGFGVITGNSLTGQRTTIKEDHPSLESITTLIDQFIQA